MKQINTERTTQVVLTHVNLITVHFKGLMCPAMSFLAAIIYYPYYAGFNMFTLLANWLKLVCYNFPFAFFTQLFLYNYLFVLCLNLFLQKTLKIEKNILTSVLVGK